MIAIKIYIFVPDIYVFANDKYFSYVDSNTGC